ncbi:MAG: CoA transferase [Rhodospirillaceae bacterium]|jgi:crotonobetainyl-CoA:carnitine CoA-transferase CaiB-like acyl-CoA transferase|nr:CoA transferase [Rhodospirillaceae bacterium]MBT4588403.1 CoA transferase [Rhodospirillaceae bacterium]MBT4940769.1 CoA transferase [Rhodospirillaceae bacterium]MBT5939832.1 CoA transferase [Rhodospirillaceae bacterium]MBT7267592.1 CoA transferase [Rhodospirillaceae bacterium]
MTLPSTALERFTILDLTRVRSGPTAVRQLADWGANVIRVEMSDKADKGKLGGPRDGSDFQNLHRGKRSLSLNLKSEKGVEIFKKLAAKADVVVENFRPDVKTRLGIDYESLKEINPGLVYASISGFGQDGPYKERPGFDQIAQGMGGLMSITGAPGEGPMRVGIPIADLTAGIFCAQGILIALLEREVSGEGQWIQTSLLQAQTFMLDFQAARWLVDGEVPGQAGNNHPTTIPMGVFETSDGHMNIAGGGQVIWQRMCEALDLIDLVSDPDYAEPLDRSKNRDALNKILEQKTQEQTTKYWVEFLNERSVPCGEINSIDQAFENPQVKHLGIAQKINSTERGEIELVGQPIDMSRTPSKLTNPPPLLGEHSDEILADLGYSRAEIADFKAADVI